MADLQGDAPIGSIEYLLTVYIESGLVDEDDVPFLNNITRWLYGEEAKVEHLTHPNGQGAGDA